MMLTCFNASLANGNGNLLSGAITLIHRSRNVRVPASPAETRDALDTDLVAATAATIESVKTGFSEIQVSQALQDTWALVSRVNKYIVERAPWVLAKDPANDATLDRTLYHAADTVRVIAALIDPAMADAAVRICGMLGIDSAEPWTSLQVGTLAAGTQLRPVEALFPRIEKTIEELRGMTTSNEPTPPPAATPATPAPAAPASTAAETPAPAADSRISIED